jgi:sugar-phosphatase
MTQRFDITVAGCLFDMDGTVVDSTAIVEAVWTEFADRHDLDAAEVIAFSHGRQTIDTVTQFLRHHTDAERRRIAFELADHEVRRTEGIVEIVGAAALIGALRQAGAPVALVTSAERDLAVSRMTAAAITLPDVVVSAEDVARGKPAPDAYLLAAQLLDVPVAECVAFEDAEAGLTAALASGALTVAVGPHVSAMTKRLRRLPHFGGLVVTRRGNRFRISG